MLPATLPQFDPKRLDRRLASLRFRLRLVAAIRGLFSLAAVMLGGAALVGLLDWRFALPALVRALALVGLLAAGGYLLLRRLFLPLSEPADNFHLALRLEERNPELNDILASAVQFLEHPADDESTSSPLLRRIAIRRAVRMSEDCDFGELIPTGGMIRAMFLLLMALGLALPPLLFAPQASRTALSRLLAPFGAPEWPASTQVHILAPATSPHRHPLGEALEIRAEITGVVPERATLSVWFDGTPPVDSNWVVEPADDRGLFVARLEPSKIQRSFRFRVKALDGSTAWHEVQVLPPPELVPLDGRPSPQIDLSYPPYTDLKPRPLPDGGSSFEAVAGTRVHLRAAVSRPMARAWIGHRPDTPAPHVAAAMLALGSASPLDSLTSHAAGRDIWERIPIPLDRDGTLIDVTFTPRLAGVYALRFEDETGFGATRMIDARMMPDPAPIVTLDRPSAGHDSLHVTPEAVMPLRATVNDPMFAVRSAWLEYRTNRDDPPRSIRHFDHRAPGQAVGAPIRLRLQTIVIDRPLKIADLRHPDGRPLQDGDSVVIQMLADDFDDVTGLKEPGRSHEVELRIVSKETLEAMLQQEQANVRANLLRLQQWQKEARQKVAEARVQQENTGKLRPEELEKLLQAEQLQQQIRSRVGDEQEGLRAEVNRIRQAQRDNQLPPSASQNRMDAVANELERLTREELESIEPLLNSARESASAVDPMKGEPSQTDPMKPDAPTGGERRKDPLADAQRHQQEVERTLEQLLQRLEPWSGANEVRGETRSLLNEQQKLAKETEDLDAQIPKTRRERLDDDQRAELDRAATKQEALAEQLKGLMSKMERLAADKQNQQRERLDEAEQLEQQAKEREAQAEQHPGTEREASARQEADRLRQQAEDQKAAAQNLQKEADALKDAAKTARQELSPEASAASPKTKMHDAAQEMKQNQLGKARQRQQESAQSLQKLLDRLEERRTDDLDRLAKKMREAEQKLDDLVDQQERLQKKVQQAQQMGNAAEREQELERLAREQETLQEQAKDLLQELSRLRTDGAAQALARASREMNDAQQRLDRGEKADQTQEEALEKLDQAQDQLEQARQQIEEELMREKVEKATARVQALRDRQEAMGKETERIHGEAMKAKTWEDALLRSLSDQIDAEEGLAGEVARLVENQFKPIKIAAKVLEHSADAMKLAAERIEARREDVKNRAVDEPWDEQLEQRLHADVVKWQQTALRRLDQFLDALKEEKKLTDGGGGQGGGGSGGGGRPGGEEIPLLAQLKALRALQAEVNEQTAEFARTHPDLSKLTDAERAELAHIRKTQRDIADLIAEYGSKAEPNEGGQP